MQRKLLNTDAKKIKVSYKHEAIVLGVETNRKKFNVKNYEGYKKDMGDIEVRYNANFWKNVALPPESEFYKKSVKQLESIYGVPLEKQFELVNK